MLIIIMLNVTINSIMIYVIMLIVVMLNVVRPSSDVCVSFVGDLIPVADQTGSQDNYYVRTESQIFDKHTS